MPCSRGPLARPSRPRVRDRRSRGRLPLRRRRFRDALTHPDRRAARGRCDPAELACRPAKREPPRVPRRPALGRTRRPSRHDRPCTSASDEIRSWKHDRGGNEAHHQNDGNVRECDHTAQAGYRPLRARRAVARGGLDQGMGETEEAEREEESRRTRRPGVPRLKAAGDDQHLADEEWRGRRPESAASEIPIVAQARACCDRCP